MKNIEGLNTQYEALQKALKVLKVFEKSVNEVQREFYLSAEKKVRKSFDLITRLRGQVNCSGFALLNDTAGVCLDYIDYADARNNYQNATDRVDREEWTVQEATEHYSKAITRFKESKGEYERKYNETIDSEDTLNKYLSVCIERAISQTENSLEKVKIEARNLVQQQNSVTLSLTNPIQSTDNLPEAMLIARYPVGISNAPLLQDIGEQSVYQNIYTNLRKKGNVIIRTSNENKNDEIIDSFVIAYIFRFIESFPLGAVNVHIFDHNTSYLYKRLCNSFQRETAGEAVKRVIQIHTDLNDLLKFRDTYCDDIFKKTSVDKPDLYAIYKSDRTDPFNLIVLRDGLVGGDGYSAADVLETVNSLSTPGDLGHKTGLRFLILDNSKSFETSMSPNIRFLVSSIRKNCEIELEYISRKATIKEKAAEILNVPGILDVYIEERAHALATAIGGKEKNIVSLEDVSKEYSTEAAGNIMYIPVGKSGGEVVEIPFSCKDEDGTIEGQCIGYMVIGQSGSGKSSFFHSVVMNGCIKYSPIDLQFWLLDFKNGGASSKYSNSGLPQIKIIAENNKIDDALCLFDMILEEMERRSKAFNKTRTDNIVEYNEKAVKEGLEYFPRIIIAIDEIQEIFREDTATVIQKQISSISTRMRSAGMHFVMVAQNLSEGKSYMLKDAFLPSASGRICFRVGQDIPRDSGFGEEFIRRKEEIAELKTGEAYVSYGKGTTKKVKMAYISPEEMNNRYFEEINSRYPGYSNAKPRVIGSKKRLSITDECQGSSESFSSILRNIRMINGAYQAVVGEDVYRMNPVTIQFSQYENSSVLLLGSDKQIASSLCSSIAISLMKQNVVAHLFNGDRAIIHDDEMTHQHPFMYTCRNISSDYSKMLNHRLDELKSVVRDLYVEYLQRQEEVQKAEDEDPVFSPIFLIINDLFAIRSFIDDEKIMQDEEPDMGVASERGFPKFSYSVFGELSNGSEKQGKGFSEHIQNIMYTLVKDGYRYNMHVILAINGDPGIWRNLRITSASGRVIIFNETDYMNQLDNSYMIKEMLKNISNDGEDETLAVWIRKKSISKIRPIIYKVTSQKENEELQMLVRGE